MSLKGTERDVSLKAGPAIRKALDDRDADALAKLVATGAISTAVYKRLIANLDAMPPKVEPQKKKGFLSRIFKR